MRKRPTQTVSERELADALGKSGRQAGLSDLVAWRRAGLLPPFASCGTGAGRTYYWSEPDIQDRAEAVYDALILCGRIDSALITIWLAGFDVPLERLRRALAHRLRVRAATGAADRPSSAPIGHAVSALMELTHAGENHAHFGVRLQDIRSQSDLRRHLERLSLLYHPLTENIALIQRSQDGDLVTARRYLLALSNDWERTARAIQSAETLFLFILALVRSGQSEILQKIDTLSLPPACESSRSRPVQSIRAAS